MHDEGNGDGYVVYSDPNDDDDSINFVYDDGNAYTDSCYHDPNNNDGGHKY